MGLVREMDLARRNRLIQRDPWFGLAQMMRLASAIRKNFGVKVLFETLASRDMTTRALADIVVCKTSNQHEDDKKSILMDIEGKVEVLQERVHKLSQSVLGAVSVQHYSGRHVHMSIYGRDVGSLSI